jgi:hypothetical protein
MFLRNVDSYKRHTAQHPRRRHSSWLLLVTQIEPQKIELKYPTKLINVMAMYSSYF